MFAIWNLLFPELRRLPGDLRGTALTRAAPPPRGPPPSKWRRSWRIINLVLWPPVILAPWAGWSTPRWGVALAGCCLFWLAWPRISRAALLIRERRIVRLRLRRVLADMGRPVCVECGYDLRAAVGRRCPECGKLLPLMRFFCRARSETGETTWDVTALSEFHARDLLAAHLGDPPDPFGVLEVRQSSAEPAESCGAVLPRVASTGTLPSAPRETA